MKKWIFKRILLAVIALCSLISCQKETGMLAKDTTDGQRLLSNLMALKQSEVQKVAYAALSDQERFDLWKAKLDNELTNENYNNKQKAKINELKNHLTVAIFQDGDAREVFHQLWLPEWVKSTKGILDGLQVYNIAFTIEAYIPVETVNNITNKADNLTSMGSETVSACICALHSGFTCPMYSSDGGWPGVRWGACKLRGTCVESRGCGALWDQECDGNQCEIDG